MMKVRQKSEEMMQKKMSVRFEEASIKKDVVESDNEQQMATRSTDEEYDGGGHNSSNSDSSYHKDYIKRRAKFRRRKRKSYPAKIENRVMWTKEMMGNLLAGVNNVGKGRWKEIWEKYDFPETVTVNKVASKWHYMTRRNLVALTGNEWVLTCQLEDIVDKAHDSDHIRKPEDKAEHGDLCNSSSEDEYAPPLKKKTKRTVKAPSVYWSMDMTNTLVDAVNDCGKGHWSEIVDKYHFPFEMTAKKIADKWNHLARNNYIKFDNNRWILKSNYTVQENRN